MYVHLQLGNWLHDCDEIFRVAPGRPRYGFLGVGWVGARKLAFFVYRRTSRPCARAGRLVTGQAIGAHTIAGGQCACAVEAGISANGPARMHTGTGSRGLGRRTAGTGLPTQCPAGRAEPLVLL